MKTNRLFKLELKTFNTLKFYNWKTLNFLFKYKYLETMLEIMLVWVYHESEGRSKLENLLSQSSLQKVISWGEIYKVINFNITVVTEMPQKSQVWVFVKPQNEENSWVVVFFTEPAFTFKNDRLRFISSGGRYKY